MATACMKLRFHLFTRTDGHTLMTGMAAWSWLAPQHPEPIHKCVFPPPARFTSRHCATTREAEVIDELRQTRVADVKRPSGTSDATNQHSHQPFSLGESLGGGELLEGGWRGSHSAMGHIR